MLEGCRQKASEALVESFLLWVPLAGVMEGGPGLKEAEERTKSNVKAWQKGGTSAGSEVEGVFKGDV